MQYTIVKDYGTERLMEKVAALLKEGWSPQGGVAVANAASMIYAQAMVKY